MELDVTAIGELLIDFSPRGRGEGGCPLLALGAETLSLEDVFLQLTGAGESAAVPGGATEAGPEDAAGEEE